MGRWMIAVASLGLGWGLVGCPADCVDEDGDGFMPSDRRCRFRPDLERGDCDDSDASLTPVDRDDDHYSSCEGDCDDTDPEVHPGADDAPCDGVDSDCDGSDMEVGAVIERFPEDGADEAYHRTLLWLWFDEPADQLEATAELRGEDGSVVLARGSWEGRYAYLTLDEPLTPATRYEVDATAGCHEGISWSFTTSDVGQPVEATSVEGATFLVDLYTPHLASPSGVGPLLSQYLSGSQLALQVEGVDDDTGELVAFSAQVHGDSDGVEQFLCLPSARWGSQAGSPPPAAWANPYLATEPFELPLALADNPLAYSVGHDTLATASFSPDGQSLAGLTLDMAADMEDLWPLLTDDPDPDAICDWMDPWSSICEPCPDDGEVQCLTMSMYSLEGERVDEFTGTHPDTGEPLDGLIEVTWEDVERWTAEGVCS